MSQETTVNPNSSQHFAPYTPSLDLLEASRPREVAPTLIEGRPSPILAPPNPSLDELLELVAGTLQLTVTQYERAKSAYGAVTTWLGAPESELAPFRPQMFPQGSTAIQTNNRPVGRNDHDVDLVCQLMVTGWTPMRVYEAILRRLAAHGTYAPMIERKSRCIRLNYETDFHLDIIPAEPAPLLLVPYGAHAVRIPDRERAAWTPSNPLGYIQWFRDQAESARMRLAKRAAAPMPPRLGPGDQTVLAMIVQLMKRYRDLEFAAPERAALAPRSIALTTLAATVYAGEQHPARALQQVATGMVDAVMAAWPARVAIPNPTNPGERFCDKFSPETYQVFVSFLFRMERDVAALVTSTGAGLPDLQARLAVLFGTEPSKQAITKHAQGVRKASEEGRLRITPRAGLTVVPTAAAPGRVVPNHRPFGSPSVSSERAR
jgi:hypothetical protein